MKKKLNLYCLLFIMAVGLGFALDFVAGIDYFMLGFTEGQKDADAMYGRAEAYKYNDVYVTFRPKSFYQGDTTDSIYNEITNEMEAVNYNKLTVQVPKEKSQISTLCNVLKGGGSMLYSVGILGFWVIFLLTIRSVKRGEVFLLSVANYLAKAAVFLIVAYVGQWLITWGDYEHAKALVSVANHEVVPNFSYDNSYLYVAFGLLVISQIIKQGKELKDEQELTI